MILLGGFFSRELFNLLGRRRKEFSVKIHSQVTAVDSNYVHTAFNTVEVLHHGGNRIGGRLIRYL